MPRSVARTTWLTMDAVVLVVRRECRRRWRSLCALALLIGLVGAVMLATLADARRTESAFDAASRAHVER